MNSIQLFNATARCLRKLNRKRRFNRDRAMRPLKQSVTAWWTEGINQLFAYLAEGDRWEKLQRHVRLALAADSAVRKALTDSDRKFLAELLAQFGYFNDADVAKRAEEIIAVTSAATFEQAAQFALRQLGVVSADFELRNEAVRDLLLGRKDAAIFATRTHVEEAVQTVTAHFYELGEHPYNQKSLNELGDILGYKAEWQAKRFALTETGIAAEVAQVETYRRNGVAGKQWNVLNVNTREDHLALNGVIVPIDKKFDCGGFPADHPLDPQLPANQVCNCHCWLSPVVDDDFTIDPDRIWEGQ